MRERMRLVLIVALGALALAACSPGQALGVLRQEVQSQVAPTPESLPDPTPERSQGPGRSQSTDTPDHGAIQVVIARGNFQQEQAIASKDNSMMRDTATDRYFRQMTQTNQELLDSNVVSVKLVAMEWGAITVRGNAAAATTYETWSTTYADGRTQQSTDRNDYRLVKQNGAWKIDSDVHPGNGPLPPGARQT
jgi:hypothetical protein